MKKIRISLAALALAGMLAACGSSDDGGSGDNDGVASVGSSTTNPDGEGESTETTVDPQEAMLAYAECMRGEGIDMPDPEFSEAGDGGGAIMVTEAGEAGDDGPSVDFDSEQFEAAEEKCSPLMEDAIGNVEIDPEQQAEMRENMLEYAQCMRDQGIDFPDPEFTDNGMVTMSMGDPDGEKPSDAEMEKMDAANEACAKEGGPIAIAAAPNAEAGD